MPAGQTLQFASDPLLAPFYLGLVTALQFTPILLFSPVGGALSDRFPELSIVRDESVRIA